jgi:molybdate transport system substrate-binding protein
MPLQVQRAILSTMGLLLAASLAARASAAPVEDNRLPPWQHGANSDVVERGVNFTVPQIDTLADFHGDLSHPSLVLYVGGNYFFVMAPLVKAFESANPEFKSRLYWETLPPGILADQLKSGGRIAAGNMTWTAKADAYFADLDGVEALVQQRRLAGPVTPYVTNSLTIMVPRGNPAGVRALTDLARPGLRLVMPNPQFEGIARQIKASLAKAGGDRLVDAVFKNKVNDGSTRLTQIHHRQSPVFLMEGLADAGVTWRTEALFQERIGNPIGHVEIAPLQNTEAVYAGAVVAAAPHPAAARLWLRFIASPRALAIFKAYGFEPYHSNPAAENGLRAGQSGDRP